MIVYFSSVSEQTKVFVEKLGLPSSRIPLNSGEAKHFEISEPYILITPSYAAGSQDDGVPKQVTKFLENSANMSNLLGVVAGGNRSYGEKFGVAGVQLRDRVGCPLLMRFEISGTDEDIAKLKGGLDLHWNELVQLKDARNVSKPEHGAQPITAAGGATGTP